MMRSALALLVAVALVGCTREPEMVREVRTWYTSGCEGGDIVSDTLEYPLGLRDSLRVIGTSQPCGKRHERLGTFYDFEHVLLALNKSLTDTLGKSLPHDGLGLGLHVTLVRIEESDLPLAFTGGLGPPNAISGDMYVGASGVGIVEYWPHYGTWVRLKSIVRTGAVSDTVHLTGLSIGATTIEPFPYTQDAVIPDSILDEIELDFDAPPPPR